ncbi:50S ribosomal protein L21 [Emticicia soli]|jgi:large subunit ribosomal protein L21|uniref:Large ribosomal subunit protein bL21 n=1 Tax=Emticicia soli TaxID=2027878 RepID=A0ABW5JD89_9BACT
MYAIVEIAGQQFKVEKGRTLYTHRLEGEANAELVFDKVLLVDNGGVISVGAPTVEGASVKATIIEHLKGEKVIVFKKKRRKGYVKKNGHRQYLTKIQIDEIAA